jgi:catechol 2,3-dioxygenase-like lactoylglutathione lyase family enzyme
MSVRLDTVFVWVTDLEHSIEWYRSLGIEPGRRHGAWQAMVTDGETRFALHQGERPSGQATAVMAFGVTDLEAEMARLAELGISPIDAVTDTGMARFTTFADPDGNEIQLLQRRA